MSNRQTVNTEPQLPIVYHKTVEMPLSRLQPHPLNRPATGISRPHIETLKALIQQNGYNASRPLTIRLLGDEYQIIEGHHRVIAAQELGYALLPCVVEDLDDVAASLRLLTSNEQEGNHPLDVGLNALKSGLSVREFAKRTGVSNNSIQRRMEAAKVIDSCTDSSTAGLQERWSQLTEIHAAPSWSWSALVEKLLEEEWTVEGTRKQVARFSQAAR